MTLYKSSSWPLLILSVLALIWILPIAGILLMAFRPEIEIVQGWWRFDPFTFTLESWINVWKKYELAPAFVSSAILATSSTLLTVLCSASASYAYEFLHFHGKKFTLILYVASYVMPQQVLLIPMLTLWRNIGLIDNPLSCIIPFVGSSFAWSIFMLKSYLKTFPKELLEAAKIDGASNIRTFRSIFLPNIGTPIAAISILQFMWTWNSLLLPMMFIRNRVPLPVLLARIQGTNEPNWDLQAVAVIITAVVPLAFFLYFQKHFSASSTSGSGGKG